MDWRALLKNRRVQLGAAAAAAAVGGFVFYRGRKAAAGGAASTQPADSSGGTVSGAPTVAGGFPDTSGTDIATWLGNYSGGVDDAIAQFGKQITDLTTTLGNMQPTHPTNGSTPPVVTPKPKPVPKPTPKPPTTPQYVTVAAFNSHAPAWNSTLSGIASHEKTSVAALLKLNPSIKNANVIATGAKIRVK